MSNGSSDKVAMQKSVTSHSSLFFRPLVRPAARMRLVCFPFAGGSAATYTPWTQYLHEDAELIAIQLPGRGSRLVENPYDSIDAMVADLHTGMSDFLDKPCIFFGHSMGAKIAFELACALHRNNQPLPARFIVSGSAAPFIPRRSAMVHALPDAAFKKRLTELNGTPERVLQNTELMSYLMPTLRADFKIAETYRREKDCILPTTLAIYGGNRDEVIAEADLMAWREVFSDVADIKLYEGGHFFINQHTGDILARINQVIAGELARIG